MHEISLVRNIFNTLHAQYTADEIATIKTIHLKVGLLSNVQPLLMQNAFNAVVATESPEFGKTQLTIDVLDIKVKCHICESVFTVENYHFICHQCNTPSKNIIQGDELMISGVEMDY
jgi:hydrogenase nickel incorporation protein HypA/HybF